MKKLSLTVAAMAVAATALTGCMKETSTLTVSKSKKVTGDVRYLIDNDFVDMMKAFDEEIPGAQDMSRKKYLTAMMELDADTPNDLPKGTGFKIVSGKNYSGWAFTFDKASFKAVNRFGKELGESPKKPLVKIALNKKKQVVLKYRLIGLDDAGELGAEGVSGDLPKSMQPRYKVQATFGGKIVSTNGKVKKKKTVTWSGVRPDSSKVLKVTAKLK
ncbi:LppM family (lipo)protein [Nocardioides yefusunii]|uniref:LppM family (Lipo)protein n=1 Tax=Nocardioides yefusunii TaxID=2500546 RepID=A0ABW1QYB8_9ACTN|nr:hypothetical protein [Nocardioides yefusunii]